MAISKIEWILPEYENNLAEFRHKLNLNIREMSSILGVNEVVYRAQELGKTSIYRKGAVKPWILKLCKEFRCHLEDIFPREVCGLPESYDKEDFVELYDNHWSSHPYMDEIEYLELRLDMEKILNKYLKDKYKSRFYEIIQLYFFQDMSKAEIGKIYRCQDKAVGALMIKIRRILLGALIHERSYATDYLRKHTNNNGREKLVPVIVSTNPSLISGSLQLRYVSERDLPVTSTSNKPITTNKTRTREDFQFYEDFLAYLKSLNLEE